MYGNFAEIRGKDEASTINDDVRSIAQLEALKRFIETMEHEAVEQKRIAQEQRVLNTKSDNMKKRNSRVRQ